ncbi:MAG TPA: dihydroorotate dehydrogenase electron transfer subunit [Dissulfurispiraceae bacterium]|nr:dihydroorotate dehydrogenase electron transfer subunit [Dissulfurispiraceae bacterium]
MSRLFKARVVKHTAVKGPFKVLSVGPLSEIIPPEPGQFFMLQTSSGSDPLLKRPLSLFRHRDGELQFLYRIRGKGTACLSRVAGGDVIEMLGPLGNAYPVPPGDFVVSAGGIGVASLFSLMENYKQRARLYYGARNSDELLMLDETKVLAKDFCITTDDGSAGSKGLITEPLMEFIGSSSFRESPMPIYACGPSPMLRALASIIKGKKLDCYVSLEEVMACGVGACLGCVTRTVTGYQRVCKEGPVFRIEDIIWE